MYKLERHLTRDGGLIQIGMGYYMHSRLVRPDERWTLVNQRCSRPSWLDGRSIQVWLVRSEQTGRCALVEAWQLSRVPIDGLLAEIGGAAGAREQADGR